MYHNCLWIIILINLYRYSLHKTNKSASGSILMDSSITLIGILFNY